jgi:hypothetical protein
MPPDSETALIQNVMVRQLADDLEAKGKIELDRDSPVVTAMRQFIDATRDGKPLGAAKQAIQRHATSHADKLQIMDVLYTTRQMEIMMEALENDQHIRKFLNRCMRRGDLRPTEAMVLFRYNYTQVVEITNDLRRKLGKSVTAENSDVETVTASVDKLDMTLQQTEKSIQQDFEKTTPQEREIMRKLIFRARRKLKDKKQ